MTVENFGPSKLRRFRRNYFDKEGTTSTDLRANRKYNKSTIVQGKSHNGRFRCLFGLFRFFTDGRIRLENFVAFLSTVRHFHSSAFRKRENRNAFFPPCYPDEIRTHTNDSLKNLSVGPSVGRMTSAHFAQTSDIRTNSFSTRLRNTKKGKGRFDPVLFSHRRLF